MKKNLSKIGSIKKTIFFSSAFLIFASVILIFVYPLLNISLKFFSHDLPFSKTKETSLRIFHIAGFTIFQAFVSSLFASILGLALAYFCATKKIRLKKFLLSLASIPVAVPSLIISLAYVFFFGKEGLLNSFVKIFLPETQIIGRNFLYSFFAVIIIQSFYNFPLALKSINDAWENIDADLLSAARLLTNKRIPIFTKIIFPEILPAFISSVLIIFIYCFFSFFIILLFGGLGLTTLEVELYQVSRSGVNFFEFAQIAFIETSIAFVLVAMYTFVKLKTYKAPIDLQKQNLKTKMSFVENFVFKLLIFVSFLFLILPIFSIFLKPIFKFSSSFSSTLQVNNFFDRLKIFFTLDFSAWKILTQASTLPAIFNTITLGLLTALFSVLSAICVIYFEFWLSVKNKTSLFLRVLPFLPLVISPLVLGFALRISFLQSSNLGFLILSFAQASTAWTLAYSQITVQFAQIPKSVLQASVLLSVNSLDAFYRVILPLIKKSCKVAFALCFAISAGDASLPLMLKLENFETLSLMIFRLAGVYRFSESACLAFLLIVLVSFGFMIFTLDFTKLKK